MFSNMKNFTRKISALALSTVLLSSLAACSTNININPARNNANKTVLSVWTWNKNQLKPAVKEFENENPNVKINLLDRGIGAEEYHQFSAAKRNTPPDIVQLEYPVITQYAKVGWLENASSVNADADRYTANAWRQVLVDGKPYALPLDSGPLTFYYNEDLLLSAGVKKAPTTWQEFHDAAKMLKEKTGAAMISVPHDASLLEALTWQADGKPYRNADTQTAVTLATDTGVQQSAKWLQSMISEGLVDVQNEPLSDNWGGAVETGKIAGIISGADKTPLIMGKLRHMKGKMVVAPAPSWDSNGRNSELGGSAMAVTTVSHNKKLAFKFIKWLTSSNSAILLRIKQGMVPADKHSLSLSAFLDLMSLPDDNDQPTRYYQDGWNRVIAENLRRVSTSFEWLPFEQKGRDIYQTLMRPAYYGITVDASKTVKADDKTVKNDSKTIKDTGTTDNTITGLLAKWQVDVVQAGVDNDFVMRTPEDKTDDENGVDAGKVKKSSTLTGRISVDKPEANPNKINKN